MHKKMMKLFELKWHVLNSKTWTHPRWRLFLGLFEGAMWHAWQMWIQVCMYNRFIFTLFFDYLYSYLHYLNVTDMCLVMSIWARAAVYGLPPRIYFNIISSCLYIIVLFITHLSMHCNASSILCMICHCDIKISLIFMSIEYIHYINY